MTDGQREPTPQRGTASALLRSALLRLSNRIAESSDEDEVCPTVLVIDDDARARDLLVRILSKAGFRAVAAVDGETGLDWARREHPAVITLDVLMPGLDGWEVLEALNGDPATASIPVIMVSELDERQMGFMLGASDYVTKPVDRQRLIEVLESHTGSGGALLQQVRELAAIPGETG